jgi:hypothetical protein
MSTDHRTSRMPGLRLLAALERAVRNNSLGLTLIVLLTVSARAGDVRNATLVGIEGAVTFEHRDADLAVRRFDERSPMSVRIVDRQPSGELTRYELRYIGTRPGPHDLREYLIDREGNEPQMASLFVNVAAVLSENHDGSLEQAESPAREVTLPYMALLRAGLAVWIAVTAVLIVKRLLPRSEAVGKIAPEPLSLADQLRPLLERALAGSATPAERARLEVLLLADWRRRFGLVNLAPAEAIRSLREDAAAGTLLAVLETWLHAPPGKNGVDVAALLQPYRASPAIADDQLAAVKLPREPAEAAR